MDQLNQLLKPIMDFLATMPFEVALLHPPLVHFAIVLPVFAFIFQLVFLTTRNAAYAKVTNSLLIVGALFIIMAFLSGKMAGPDVKPLLSESGKEAFTLHAQIGFALTIFFIVLLILKLIAVFVNKRNFRIFVGLLMLVGAAGVLYQGKTGGDLVYQYAAGVECPDEDEEESAPAPEAVTAPVEETKAPVEPAPAEEVKPVQTEKPVEVETPVPAPVQEAAPAAAETPEQTVEAVQESVETKVEEVKEAVENKLDTVEEAVVPAAQTPKIIENITETNNTPVH